MVDRSEAAQGVHDAVAALNNALDVAIKAGLRVEVEVSSSMGMAQTVYSAVLFPYFDQKLGKRDTAISHGLGYTPE